MENNYVKKLHLTTKSQFQNNNIHGIKIQSRIDELFQKLMCDHVTDMSSLI